MFILLLLPPICGFILFIGLLTAKRGPVVRFLLSVVLAGFVAPIAAILAQRILVDAPLPALLGATAFLCASVLWRVVVLLPVPRSHVRATCWLLVLTSCTLITVLLTAPRPTGFVLHLPLVPGLLVVASPFMVAHLLLALLGRSRQVLPLVAAKKRAAAAGRGRQVAQPAPPLLSRPLELVGAGAPYYPLAPSLTAGSGPAAVFSTN